MRLSPVAKTVVAAVMAAMATINVVLGDGVFDVTDGLTVTIAVLTALGVYVVPNKP